MAKQGRFLIISTLCILLAGCLGGLWTGASMVYDRHNVYKKISDYHLVIAVTDALFVDKTLKENGNVLDVAVFNGDVLIAGHVSSDTYLSEINTRLKPITGQRRIYNQVVVNELPSNNAQDSWITTKIRSSIFADGSIDPNAFKIVTSDRVVYLMGDVRQDQGEKVIKMARTTAGVERVVKMLRYFTYESK